MSLIPLSGNVPWKYHYYKGMWWNNHDYFPMDSMMGPLDWFLTSNRTHNIKSPLTVTSLCFVEEKEKLIRYFVKPFPHTIALLIQSLGSWGSEAGCCWWLAPCWRYPGSCHNNERIYQPCHQPSPFRLYDWRGSNHFKIWRFWKAHK